ncbi:MAG TPA: EVE domain-containing protein [Calditrichia bacterium]|nr:EVE domain-containing protein [Calditrichia bacterium]
MNYWLMKTEPDVFGIEDLKARPDQTEHWDGIRNYQARNYMRDMKVGDQILFYHSQITPPVVAGVAEVVREAYPDHTQFDPNSKYHDPKSDPDNPRWHMVNIRYVGTFATPIPLPQLKETPGLEEMVLLKRGSRLSIQPVTAQEWTIINKLGKLVK